jgi:hypothetical protein
MKNRKMNFIKLLFFSILFLPTCFYSQSNGIYKSEFGAFTLKISNFKKNDSFNFTWSANEDDQRCFCWDMNGKAEIDPLDEEFNGVQSFQYYVANSNGELEPYCSFSFVGNQINVTFVEGVEFCGNCAVVDTEYKKVVQSQNNKKPTGKPKVVPIQNNKKTINKPKPVKKK